MATIRAQANGNWTDTATWFGGVVPTASDDVYSNTFTVTINTSPTVLSIRATSATGIAAGGRFLFTNGTTVACTGAGFVGSNFNNSEILFNLNSPSTVNLVGTITGSGGLCIDGNGTVNVTGSVNNSISPGNTPVICFQSSAANGATLNITGDVNGLTSAQATVRYQSFGANVNVLGNVTASSGSGGCLGEITSVNATLSVTGTITATDNIPAITVTSTSPSIYFSGPFICSTNGTHAVVAPKWRWTTATPTNTYYQIRNANLSAIRPLYTADSVGGNPAVANVRSGTVYGPSNELTGTCAVPGASSVASGVPVGATTGTAVITAATLRAAMGLDSANLSSTLAAIPTTVAPTAAANASAVRTELTTELGRIDVATSTRLAPAGTLARVTLVDTVTNLTNGSSGQSASAIASQVRTELAPELARVSNCATVQTTGDQIVALQP